MTQITDLDLVEVEHLLGYSKDPKNPRPLVKLRVIGKGTILLGELDPDDARKLASDLGESAARSEYELDLFSAMDEHGFEHGIIASVLSMVREGEAKRFNGGSHE